MKIEYVKNVAVFLLILVMCMVQAPLSADAAEHIWAISFVIKNTEGNPQSEIQMKVFRVANTSGVLTEDFEETGLNEDALLKEKNSRSSVGVLMQHAADSEVAGMSAVTEENGTASLNELENGIYMVFCEDGQDLTFEPFLVTVKYRKVTAEPKTSDTPEDPQNPEKPQNPEDSEDSDELETPDDPGVPEAGDADDESESPENQDAGTPTIPQTGENYWLVWILLGAGVLLSMSGVWCLHCEKGNRHE